MQTQYQIGLHRDDGSRIATLDRYFALSWTKSLNSFGAFSIDLPRAFDSSLLKNDTRVSIWRRPPNGAMYLEFYGLVRIPETKGIQRMHSVSGYDFNYLLYTHWTEYAMHSSQETATATPADDMMKAIIRNEMGASATNRWPVNGGPADTTGAARALNASYFTVQSDTSQGAAVTGNYAFRRVLDVLKELANSSRQSGTDIYFEIQHVNDNAMVFRTFKNQLGMDRRSTSSQPVIFGVDFGNLADPALTLDGTDEINAAMAIGYSTGDVRIKAEAVGTNATASLWSRTESVINSTMSNSVTALSAEANAALIINRIKQTFNCKIINVANTIYGRDYNFGDRITLTYDNQQFDAMIRGVTCSVANGIEQITPALEIYT